MSNQSTAGFKFFGVDQQGETTAAFLYAEDAAMWVAAVGKGAVVVAKTGKLLWAEGQEEESAANSYDGAATIMRERIALRAQA